MKVTLTSEALADLKEIGRRIALDNPRRARSFVRELTDASMSLDRQPRRFPIVLSSCDPPVRKRVHHDYLIFYRVRTETVQIVRIVHGARDWVAVLRDFERGAAD